MLCLLGRHMGGGWQPCPASATGSGGAGAAMATEPWVIDGVTSNGIFGSSCAVAAPFGSYTGRLWHGLWVAPGTARCVEASFSFHYLGPHTRPNPPIHPTCCEESADGCGGGLLTPSHLTWVVRRSMRGAVQLDDHAQCVKGSKHRNTNALRDSSQATLMNYKRELQERSAM